MIYYIIIGALAGWIGGQIMRGSSFGMIGNIVIGILGSIIGGWLFKFLGIKVGDGFTGSLLTALVGAVVMLWAIGKAESSGKKRKR